ncbi:pyruvate ferredoxin oxidoreductase [Candidatus Bathyarchaeota archaeon]|nr:pyruvate ferredoxin oxidoreductase [Candidatus Bathyarchaeota archaeon]
MKHMELMVGNKAVAYGAKLARVQVISAYPITPQTTIVQYLAEFVAEGELKARFIEVESELSAMVAVQGASFAGARVFTATSGPGLLLMHHPMMEGSDLPVVMSVVHRSNKSMQPDHSDLMAQRDNGWIQLYCENNQEALDTALMSYKIAEDSRQTVPTIFGIDGYILSYTAEPVEIPDQEKVDEWLPPLKAPWAPDINISVQEWRRRQGRMSGSQKAWIDHDTKFRNSLGIIKEAHASFEKTFGRGYGNGLLEEYNCENAEAVIIAMGTIASTARSVVDDLQKEGKRVGLVKLKCYRPFPAEEIRNLAKKYHAIGVIDRNVSLGSNGNVFNESRSAVYDMVERPKILGFHTGMAGSEVTPQIISKIAEKTLKSIKEPVDPIVEWVGGA